MRWWPSQRTDLQIQLPPKSRGQARLWNWVHEKGLKHYQCHWVMGTGTGAELGGKAQWVYLTTCFQKVSILTDSTSSGDILLRQI